MTVRVTYIDSGCSTEYNEVRFVSLYTDRYVIYFRAYDKPSVNLELSPRMCVTVEESK